MARGRCLFEAGLVERIFGRCGRRTGQFAAGGFALGAVGRGRNGKLTRGVRTDRARAGALAAYADGSMRP